jgi:hypothetical protein
VQSLRDPVHFRRPVTKPGRDSQSRTASPRRRRRLRQ